MRASTIRAARAEGRTVRARARHALRVLPGERAAASAMREAARGDRAQSGAVTGRVAAKGHRKPLQGLTTRISDAQAKQMEPQLECVEVCGCR